jgi:hypothetical protein
MAGKALNALRKQKPDQVIDVDELAATIPPGTSTHFTTAVVQTDMEVECRDDDGNITTAASLKLEFVGPALAAQLGDQVIVQGGAGVPHRSCSPRSPSRSSRQALAEAREVARVDAGAAAQVEHPDRVEHGRRRGRRRCGRRGRAGPEGGRLAPSPPPPTERSLDARTR